MPRIHLFNGFHNSSVSLNLPAHGRLSDYQIRRAKKELCGGADCSCSGPLGTRTAIDQPLGKIILDNDGNSYIHDSTDEHTIVRAELMMGACSLWYQS